MQCWPVLLLTFFALSAGCLDDGATGSSAHDDARLDDAGVRSETVRVAMVQAAPAAGVASPFDGQAHFDVPAGTMSLEAVAEWDCVMSCSLHVRLLAPDGTVQAEDSGWGVEMAVAAPAPGTWKVEWSSTDGATVGVMGEMALTFTIAS